MVKREGLFRGKRKDNGEWVYGDLLHIKSRLGEAVTEICTLEMKFQVYPETVSEFTRRCDKNGTQIFENDYHCDCDVYHPAEKCEVIGNIHDNPELLEVCNG